MGRFLFQTGTLKTFFFHRDFAPADARFHPSGLFSPSFPLLMFEHQPSVIPLLIGDLNDWQKIGITRILTVNENK